MNTSRKMRFWDYVAGLLVLGYLAILVWGFRESPRVTLEEPAEPIRRIGAILPNTLNLKSGDTLRHPVAYIHGRLNPPEGDFVDLFSTEGKFYSSVPVVGGHFQAFVPLTQGINRIELRAGASKVPLVLNYRPMTTTDRIRFARVILYDDKPTPPSSKDHESYREHIDVTAKLAQTYMAEEMFRQCAERNTFALDTDPRGKVHVYLLYVPRRRLPPPDSHTQKRDSRQISQICEEEVAKQIPSENALWCFLVSKEVELDVWLGSETGVIVGDRFMQEMPQRWDRVAFSLQSDSPYAKWAMDSLTAFLHELGHGMGCQHSPDPSSVMYTSANSVDLPPFPYKGSSVAHFEPFFTQWLYRHRRLRPEGTPPEMRWDYLAIKVSVQGDSGTIRARNGISCLCISGEKGDALQTANKSRSCQFFSKAMPKRLSFSLREIRKESKVSDLIWIKVMDAQGHVTEVRVVGNSSSSWVIE